jgi:hypothetical protein
MHDFVSDLSRLLISTPVVMCRIRRFPIPQNLVCLHEGRSTHLSYSGGELNIVARPPTPPDSVDLSLVLPLRESEALLSHVQVTPECIKQTPSSREVLHTPDATLCCPLHNTATYHSRTRRHVTPCVFASDADPISWIQRRRAGLFLPYFSAAVSWRRRTQNAPWLRSQARRLAKMLDRIFRRRRR